MRISYKMRRRLRDALLLFLTALLASQPLMVSASSIPSPQQVAMDATVDAGEAYIEHVGGAMLHAASSVKRIDAINAVDVETLSEGSLIQAREDLWNLAQSLSLVIGGAKELAQSVEALQLDPIEATDVQSDAQAGLPEETREDLSTYAGLSSAQVDGIESELAGRVQRRFAIASSGLPEENVVQLSNAGFTAGEIAEIESALSSWGLADSSLDTRQDQFNAARNEFAAGRSQALIAYVQLLGKQIRVRQANGIAPRAVTQEELDSLAQDELRLLIHAVHLQELWGDDPRLDIGEGDWWFIERYATRAAERLEEVILDSQNHGLVAELLFILHFASLAETARAGDPDYVKNELDAFVQLLSFETDAQAFVVDQRGRTHGLAKLVARVVSSEPIREHIEWSLEPAAVIVHADLIQHRLNTGDIFTSQSPAGAIEELDETNNQLGFLFAAGLEFWDQLDVNVLLVALDILEFINDGSMLAWIEAILTGDVETPAQFGATVLLGVIPVLGAIPDIISLVIDPSIFIKAVSIFGIICSLGDVLALLGLEPIAGVSFLGDAASAVIKGLFKYADEAAQFVLNSLKLKQAFNVILDFFKLTLKSVGDLGGSLDEVLEFLKKLFTGDFKLWDNFITFVRRVGADTLVKMGFDEGSSVVGGILRRGGDLADDALRAVDNVADDLARVGADFSDEAFDGLGEIANDIDESGVRKFLDSVGCVLHASAMGSGMGVLAKTIPPTSILTGEQLQDSGCAFAGEIFELAKRSNLDGWSDDALSGVGNLARNNSLDFVETTISSLRGAGYSDDIIGRTFGLFQHGGSALGDGVIEGATKLVSRNLDDLAVDLLNSYADDVAERAFRILGESIEEWDPDYIKQLGVVLERNGSLSDVANRIDHLKNVDGIDNLVSDLGQLPGGTDEVGALFQLEYASTLPVDKINRLSDVDIDGKAGDILFDNFSTAIDTKFRNWPVYNDFVLDMELLKLLKQVDKYRERYPFAAIQMVFDSRPGALPDLIRNGLEAVGVVVKTYP